MDLDRRRCLWHHSLITLFLSRCFILENSIIVSKEYTKETLYHENLELLDTEKLKVKKNLDGRSLLVWRSCVSSTFRREYLSLTKYKNNFQRKKIYPVPCSKNMGASARKYEKFWYLKQLIKTWVLNWCSWFA